MSRRCTRPPTTCGSRSDPTGSRNRPASPPLSRRRRPLQGVDLAGVDARAEAPAEAAMTPEKGGAGRPHRVEAVRRRRRRSASLIDEGKGSGAAFTRRRTYSSTSSRRRCSPRDGGCGSSPGPRRPRPRATTARASLRPPGRSDRAAPRPTVEHHRRRSPRSAGRTERDELELVRAHVPRGEAVTWARASIRRRSRASPSPISVRRSPLEVAAPSALGSNLGRGLAAPGSRGRWRPSPALLRAKQRAVRAAARLGRGPRAAAPRRPRRGRAVTCSALLAVAALATLLWIDPASARSLVALAMAARGASAARGRSRDRAGPGAWPRIAESRVLLARPPVAAAADAFDLTTWRGRIARPRHRRDRRRCWPRRS